MWVALASANNSFNRVTCNRTEFQKRPELTEVHEWDRCTDCPTQSLHSLKNWPSRMDIISKEISDNKPDKGPNYEVKILSEFPGPS
jgi:hypothetical protein